MAIKLRQLPIDVASPFERDCVINLSCFHKNTICIREQICIYAHFAHVCKSICYFAFTWLDGSKSISVKIGNCSLKNKHFTDFLIIDYFKEMLIK